ncbi:3-carboxy-cis,cis-muconate cycloisomerase [Pararhizobium capsulatum DSM 1112]|uniref:3-carboxy-cis,cis-muconate cycloisomerase n=1 Tax=Pararhizobium capsulatum DSM 1112 TaxID=1121113 RepID=A0ABU0BS33_9HYPH|nr:3-carboxy-cis,cis-muconate cycloisomerase [Pararhizobium capsulatum]MDQ0321060.1 3-carboxy-cis,cis-muconate cycloisomerase [Pararhizobium capsulatum DSM 1112]
MTVSVFDHPYLSGLLGDEEIGAQFTAEGDIAAMLAFEAALARAEAGCGLVPPEAAARILDVCATFRPDVASLRKATGTDGVVIPDLVRQLRDAIGGDAAKSLHLGATSQDVIDTSLMLRLKKICFILGARLYAITRSLDGLDAQFGKSPLMGHTRMQAAIPITVSNRLTAWKSPLVEYGERLMQQRFPLQFGGAAGTLDKLYDKAAMVRAALAADLGLTDQPQWQSQRLPIVDIANLFSLITGSLGKFGQDIALLAQGGTEIKLRGGGGSSAMAHKQNPVAAETLMALARFNATQIAGIHQSIVHEQERSGAAWTLEWMLLPPMAMAAGTSLKLAQQLAENIVSLGGS